MTWLRTAIVTTALTLAATGATDAGKLYKWVDEDGNVHYSDHVPPSKAKKAREELNERGMTVRNVDRAKTEAEREAERKRRQREKARREAEQRRAQKVERLRRTYTTLDDLKRSRDQKLEAIENTITLTGRTIESQRANLKQLMSEAGRVERNGKQPSEELKAEIEDMRSQIKANERFIEEKQAEKEELRARYERDIALYKARVMGEQSSSQHEPAEDTDPGEATRATRKDNERP